MIILNREELPETARFQRGEKEGLEDRIVGRRGEKEGVEAGRVREDRRAGAGRRRVSRGGNVYKERKWDSKRMHDSGGMPSSHSATVSALAVAIGIQKGTGSPVFAIAVVLACIILLHCIWLICCVLTSGKWNNSLLLMFIVMYDASGVRPHASRQAEVSSLRGCLMQS
ncbi:hypothetical protein K1719_044700 [Acacia pycnantha]|nr:hypothetical protein K1719_044700 [Acacia pycnantha]